MDLTNYYEPFKQLVGDYDLTERLKESARLYFNNNSINVNPFGSIFEAFILAIVLVALLSWIIEVKVEGKSDYGLQTRSDAEYQPYIQKLQRQVQKHQSLMDVDHHIDRFLTWSRWRISRMPSTHVVESTPLITRATQA